MKFKSRCALLLPIVLSMGMMACSKVEYDYRALGYADNAEMQAAFAKGYHTKQKLIEMTSKVVVAASAPQVAASEPTPSNKEIDLPIFEEREDYSTARQKMIAAKWVPFHSPEAEKCLDSDLRCKDRPEMISCSGSGMASCLFIWNKNGKTASISTFGEERAMVGKAWIN